VQATDRRRSVVVAAKHRAPYGAWRSPITSGVVTSSIVSLAAPQVDGGWTYWTEGRPTEDGRTVIVRAAPDGAIEDVTPTPFNVRTRVHEYGGGAYLVDRGEIFFSNFADGRLYHQINHGPPIPITAEKEWRYADFVPDHVQDRLIAVREDHIDPSREAVNTLVALDRRGEREQIILASGNDFYSSPRISADGARLAWLTWNHPNMPWDSCELWVAAFDPNGRLASAAHVAGGDAESIFQPEWSPDGSLYFVSDRSGWWNLYRLRGGETTQMTDLEAELGVPQWVFGRSTYAILTPQHVLCIANSEEIDDLRMLSTESKDLQPIATPYTDISSICCTGDRAVFIGASAVQLPEVAQLHVADQRVEVLQQSGALDIDESWFSRPQSIVFPTTGGASAHALYYPPCNPEYEARTHELPPLLVGSHGGPTSAYSTGLQLGGVQYWTSRGFAVVDVNYGGSTGYGRAYRQRLDGQWGVVDVDDCVNAARYLVEHGLADPERLVIRGGSAGGYTTLCAMTFRDTFAAGASYFGIADLKVFVRDTHKFESRYLDRLIGQLPEQHDLYRERSALPYIDQISRPIILFQGLDDKVVPPNQAVLMADALRDRGIPFAHVAFEGEGHGFRKAENIRTMHDGELYFYSRIFGFELAEELEPIVIENL